MKKNLLFICLTFILLFLSGCIISFTPKNLNQTMQVGEEREFSIETLNSQSIQWIVEGDTRPDLDDKTSFTYKPDKAGTYYILVNELSEDVGNMPVLWKVTVTNP